MVKLIIKFKRNINKKEQIFPNNNENKVIRKEIHFTGDVQGVGRGDSTDPEVMAKYRGRKQSSDDESEEQYQGIRM